MTVIKFTERILSDMSKYQFNLDNLNPDSTHGKILANVKDGSTVLECGCSSGYMTKYLTEQLHCRVDVIDIVDEDVKSAARYARDAYCGDLNTWGWVHHFDGRKYDCILFADVLEHLLYPEAVLKKAMDFLENDGEIIVSIPNICHNDIIIRMFYDLFSYTDIGILDNTHLHFWGLKDFAMMCNRIGLHAYKCDCVSYKTGTTEQRSNPNEIDQDLLKCLEHRNFGEVYQFVFACRKWETEMEVKK